MSTARISLVATLKEALLPLPFRSETPGPTSRGQMVPQVGGGLGPCRAAAWRQRYRSELAPHLSAKTLVTERGLDSIQILNWHFLSLFKCLRGRRRTEPTVNNKTVIKMRIIIIGVSGFDSQKEKCIGSAFEEEPTFRGLPWSSSHYPPLSIL